MKKTKIPRCQQIHMEYQKNLNILKETINEIQQGSPITEECFIDCMSFLYREGWGDCFGWQGDLPGEETRKEFFKTLPIKRYGRN